MASTVNLTVIPINDPPTSTNFTKEGMENQTIFFNKSDFTQHF